ncbi:hypothetical protein TrST_g1578 [Triparma strigata]|uniref:Uncharacterized protein n=1 Tax=Triparma strigata TaxID=1606541 RepID=A0A9W6ZXF0_9STRA|nr:hypothetical protein TrST_g1578 [Triparma strigata]
MAPPSPAKVYVADTDDRRSNRKMSEPLPPPKRPKLSRMGTEMVGSGGSSVSKDLPTLHFLPYSKFRNTWDVFIFVVIVYNSIVTPFRISILTDLDEGNSPIVLADYFFDAIFVMDTCLQFYLPFVDEATGTVVTDKKAIKDRYVRSWSFYISVVACLPILNIIPTAMNVDVGIPRELINLLRMSRVLHFMPAFKELKFYMNKSRQVNESMFRMNVILFFAVLGLSVFGCVYFFFSVRVYREQVDGAEASYFCDQLGEDNSTRLGFLETEETWVSSDPLILDRVGSGEGCHYGLFFVRSIYYMMQTLFTIGYGDAVVPNGENKIEMYLACIFMLIGVFGYGLIIANMTSVLANVDVVSMRYRHEMDLLSKWMIVRSMPDALRERINVYFHYIFRRQRGMLDEDLFHDLPPQLSSQLANMHLKMVTKVPFFSEKIRSDYFVSEITKAFQHRVYAPGSYILYQFEKQRELFIVTSGRCDIYIKGNKDAISSLTPGDFIGDYQLLFGTVNQVGVRAPDFTEVLALTFDAFEVFCDNPSFDFLGFRDLGGNFRNSDDQGALDTINVYKEQMKKWSAMISTVSKGSKNKKLEAMMEKSAVVVHGIMIYPHDKFHVYWDSALLLIKFLYCVMIPVRICWNITDGGFSGDASDLAGLKESFDPSLILEYIFDIVYILDMCGQLYCFAFIDYSVGSSEVIVDRQQIRERYLRSSRFRLDLFIAFPYDIVGPGIGYYSILRVPKMVRLSQLVSNVVRLQKHFEEAMQITLTETHISIINMAIITLVIILWSSVGWNICRNLEADEENFIKSVYWSFTTFTTVGYGDITPNTENQTFYALLIGAFGAVVCAAIIANVTSFVHDVEISEDNIEHKLNSLKWFLEGHNVSFEYIEKVHEYFAHIERDQDGLNEETLLTASVPSHVRQDILVHITSPMVLKCEFFQGCESGFIRMVMLSLEQSFFSTLFMIMTTNTPATGMYFVKSGIVELLSDKKGTLILNTRLSADDSFAEGSLLEHWTENPFVARAGTDCELWFLARTKFNRLLQDFPDVRLLLENFQRKANTSKKRSCTVLTRQSILLSSEKILESKHFFIHPDHLFIKVWMPVVLFFILNNLIMVPFRTAFLENFPIEPSVVFDYIGDIVFISDTIIRSNYLGYYDDGHLIVAAKAIRKNFRKSGHYFVHFVSALPLDFIAFFVDPPCPLGKFQLWSLLRLAKCARILEMAEISDTIEKNISKSGFKIHKNALRISKLLVIILLSAHWLGGMFFMLGNVNQHEKTAGSDISGDPTNWLEAHSGLVDDFPVCDSSNTPQHDRLVDQYVAALYWAMATLTTVGYGDVTAISDSEVLFATFVLIIGTGIYTIVIASLEDIVSQLDVTSSLYKMKMDKVQLYMGMHGLPLDLRNKVVSYYNICWTTQKGVHGRKLLHYMPRAMRSELLFEMLNDLLSQMFFIKDCSSDFVSSVLECLSFDIYTTGDVLFVTGEQADTVFIIHSGDVDLLTPADVKFKTVSGSILGDGNFFLREPHICNAKASATCEIFTLTFDDFWVCLHDSQLTPNFIVYLDENKSDLLKFGAMVEKMMKNLKGDKMRRMMENKDENLLPKHIILPDSKIRRAWDVVACLLTTVTVVAVPYRICFSSVDFNPAWLAIDLLTDIYFLADVYLRLRHFAEMKDGFVVTKETEFRIMYLHNNFKMDLFSALPLSHFVMIGVSDMQTVATVRLLQCLRVSRFTFYLDQVVVCLDEYANIIISTAILRIVQMFVLVLFLTHWSGCVYFYVAKTGGFDEEDWVTVDAKTDASADLQYLRSFYWALYTISTVGYGSVPCNTIVERLFAMIVMAVGAVICDAGITAVLTSLISNKDHQAGTNHRRIECCKKFMQSAGVTNDFKERVLDFYKYADSDLKNLDEDTILDDLSLPIKNNILSRFCYDPLRKTSLLSDVSDGFVSSLVKMMSPYIAVPKEKISEIGKESFDLFVMQRGRATSSDDTGNHQEVVATGAVIGHIATKANYDMNGPLTKGVEVTFIDVKNLVKGSGDPYLMMKCGFKAVRSTIKKTKKWNEVFNMKLIDHETDADHGGTSKEATVELFGWKKNQSHHLFGSCKLNLEEAGESDEKRSYDLTDSSGHKVGTLRMVVKYYDLEAADIAKSHELNVVAESYCHMYRLETYKVDGLRTFYDHSKIPDLKFRLPTVIEEEEGEYSDFVEKEGTALAWRRPSKPILEVKKVDNLLAHLEEVDEDEDEESDEEEEDESEEEEVRLTLEEIQARSERMKAFKKHTRDGADEGLGRGKSILHGRGHTNVEVLTVSPPKPAEDIKLPPITSPKQESSPKMADNKAVVNADSLPPDGKGESDAAAPKGVTEKNTRKSMKSKSPGSAGRTSINIKAERAKIMASMEDDSPALSDLDSSGHGGAIVKRARQESMDAAAFTERVKRRNSITADPRVIAQLMGGGQGNKDAEAQGRTLRKSQWAGRSTIRAPTMSYSGKAGNDSLKKLLPSQAEIAKMAQAKASSPKKMRSNPSFRQGVRQSMRRGSVQVERIVERRTSLLDRAKKMHLSEKDWDNVSELDAMKYEKKTGETRTSFFIEWGGK